jgi:hypothetical protein
MSVNPYEPPLAVSDAQPLRKNLPHTTPSWFSLALVPIGVMAYFIFTYILISGGGHDRTAGYLFLLNAPIMLFWVASVYRRGKRSFILGLAAAGVHLLIHSIMLAFEIGDFWIVCGINGSIASGLLLLSALCWHSARLTRPETT